MAPREGLDQSLRVFLQKKRTLLVLSAARQRNRTLRLPNVCAVVLLSKKYKERRIFGAQFEELLPQRRCT